MKSDQNQSILLIITSIIVYQLKKELFSHSNSGKHSGIADANADVNLTFANAKVLTLLYNPEFFADTNNKSVERLII